MKIICTEAEKNLLKRSIKANECSTLCDFKPLCKKPKDMTCGEYIISIISFETEGNDGRY